MADSTARLPRLLSRHATVGAACALLNIGIVHVGTAVLGWPYVAAALVTCFVTIPTSYMLHRRHSFRVGGRANWPEFLRFGLQQLLQFLVGLALLATGVEWLGLGPTVSMALATFVLWLFAFTIQRLWVFRAAQATAGRA